jgi:hypothetical protein
MTAAESPGGTAASAAAIVGPGALDAALVPSLRERAETEPAEREAGL